MLSRQISERIRIGPDVWVEVLEIQPGKVRLGFSAPRGVSIMREEVLHRQEQVRKEDERAQR